MTRWALLIGIDFYSEQPLKGSVNDIEVTHEYVEENTPESHISVLTATPQDSSEPCRPKEDPSRWPTISNIKSCLRRITYEASPKDQVYIHYSGHGERLLSPPHLNHNMAKYVTTDHHVALAVLDESATDVDFFEGAEFAGYIINMEKKGLLVTLVLDCCFSGHVFRKEPESESAIRTLIKSRSQSHNATHTDRSLGARNALRTANALPAWIIDPNGYLVITACGPHELAREKEFNQKAHGVLSYHLNQILKFIKRHGARISYQSLFNRLVAVVRSESSQAPMSYGGLHCYFFEGVLSDASVDFVAISTRGNELILEAGLAHGLCQGDTYAIHPFDMTEFSDTGLGDALFMAEAASVGPLRSTMKPKTPGELEALRTNGLKARLTASAASKPSIFLRGEYHDRENWIQNFADQPFLRILEIDTAEGPEDIVVETHEADKFAILNKQDEPFLGLPASFPTSGHGLRSVIEVLSHFVKFKHFASIQSPSPVPPLRSKFTLELRDEDKKLYNLDEVIEIAEGTDLNLRIINTSNPPITLYATVLNFDPLWKVHCLPGDSNNAGSCVIAAGNSVQSYEDNGNVAWGMEVPAECRSNGACEDLIKVFVSNQPTSFHTLLLPDIRDLIEAPGIRQQALTPTPATSRASGSIIPSNQEEEFVVVTFRLNTLCKY